MKIKIQLTILIIACIFLLTGKMFGFSDNIVTCSGNKCRAANNLFWQSNIINFDRNNINNITYKQEIIHIKGGTGVAYDIYVVYNDGRSIKICRVRYKTEEYVQEQLEKMNKLIINSTNDVKIKF